MPALCKALNPPGGPESQITLGMQIPTLATWQTIPRPWALCLHGPTMNCSAAMASKASKPKKILKAQLELQCHTPEPGPAPTSRLLYSECSWKTNLGLLQGFAQ